MFNFFKFTKTDSNAFFDEIYKKSKDQIAIFDNTKKLTKQGQFEVLIFCACIILNKSNLDNDIKLKYLRYLVNLRKKFDVSISSGETVDLINHRINFIGNEFKNLNASTNYIPGSLYHIFYENPLTLAPVNSFDLPQVIKCGLSFSLVVKNLSQT